MLLWLLRSRLLGTIVARGVIGKGRRTILPRDPWRRVDPSTVLRHVIGGDSADAVDVGVWAGASVLARAIHCNEVEAWRWMESAWPTGDDRSGCDGDETSVGIAAARAIGKLVGCGVSAGAVALFGSCALLGPLVSTFVSFVRFRFEVWRTG